MRCHGVVQKFSTTSIRKGEDVASDVKTEFKIGKVDTEIKVDTKNKVRGKKKFVLLSIPQTVPLHKSYQRCFSTT